MASMAPLGSKMRYINRGVEPRRVRSHSIRMDLSLRAKLRAKGDKVALMTIKSFEQDLGDSSMAGSG